MSDAIRYFIIDLYFANVAFICIISISTLRRFCNLILRICVNLCFLFVAYSLRNELRGNRLTEKKKSAIFVNVNKLIRELLIDAGDYRRYGSGDERNR